MSQRPAPRPAPLAAALIPLALALAVAPATETAAQPLAPTLNKPLYWMGDPANPPGSLSVPFGVAAAPDGSVYVADTGNDRIQHVGADGTTLHVWGTPGSGPLQLAAPRAVAVGPDGTVFVADAGNNRVSRFSPDGTLIDQVRGGPGPDGDLRFPGGVAVAPDGTWFVADTLSHRIQVFAPDGTWLRQWGRRGAAEGELNEPTGLVVDPEGTVHVVDRQNHRIQAFRQDGTFIRAWGTKGAAAGQLNQPWDIAAHPDGTVFVTDRLNHRVQRFSPQGEPLGTFGTPGAGEGELNLPTAVDIAPDGSLVVTDMNNSRLQWFGADGAFRRQWGGPAPTWPSMHGLAAAPDGTAYVVDMAASTIWRLAADGSLLGRWGQPGSGDGEFRMGAGFTLKTGPDGTVYAMDDGNRRVQWFDPDGTYRGQWPIAAPDGGTSPVGFARAADGSFLIGDAGTYRIRRFGPTGAPLAAWGGRGDTRGRYYGINEIAAAPDGTVYVVDHIAIRVHAFDALGQDFRVLGSDWDGTCRAWSGQPGIRYQLDVAPDGSLYGSGDRGMVHWRPDGSTIARWGLDDPMAPAGPWAGRVRGSQSMALAGADRLLATGSPDGRVHVVVFGPAYAGTWRVAYFGDRWLSGWQAAVGQAAEPAQDWGTGAPVEGLPADGWSARLSRVTPLAAGAYRFTVRARGGARLWLDDQVLVDRWHAAAVDASAEIRVLAGDYFVRLEYNDPGGEASVALAIEPVDAVAPSPTATPTDRPTSTASAFPTATASPTYTPNPRATPWPTAFPNRLFLPRLAAETGPATVPTATPPPPAFAAIEGIDVEHYAIRLTVRDLASADIEADVAVTLRALAPRDTVELHVEPEALKVRAVEVGGAAVSHVVVPGRPNPYGLTGARLRTWLPRRLAAGETMTLRIRYVIDAATFTGIRGFMARDVEGQTLLFTRGLPYYNRYWLPSHDHPSDAATAAFELRVPPDSVAAANGLLDGGNFVEGSGIGADGLRAFTWRQGVPIPVYLMAVAIGPFGVDSAEVCYTAAPEGGRRVACDGSAGAPEHRLPLVWYYPRTMPEDMRLRTRAAIDGAADAAVLYAGALGAYPFEKLGFFSAPLPYSSEYASLIALSLPNGDRDALHEVLHSWWGDAVRIPHWGDFWIKEGLTSYFTGYADEVARDLFANGTILVNPCSVYPMRGGPDTDPMDAFINDDLARRRNRAPYERGAAVVHDLRHRVAEVLRTDIWDPRAKAVWLGLMRDLYLEHRGRTLGTEQLEAFVRSRLGPVLGAAGVDVPPATLGPILDAWAWRWFHGGETGQVGGPGAW